MLVCGVMSLYKGCKTAFSVDGELSSSFSVKFGVHQGSPLSPLFFIMIMDVLTEDVRDGSLMELMYAGLVLCGESLNGVMGKYGGWKNAVGGKDPMVNVYKQKVCSYYLGREVVFQNWILLVSVVSGLVVIRFSVQNVLDQFCCTVAKSGNLLLRMRRGCVGWRVVWSGWCVG